MSGTAHDWVNLPVLHTDGVRCANCGEFRTNTQRTHVRYGQIDVCPGAGHPITQPDFERCANCGALAAESVVWNPTGGWSCDVCQECDYPEAAE